MSQPCAIKDCKRASRTLCHCCNQNLCRDHFNEHDDLLNAQLNPFTDQINTLADRLAVVSIDKITNNARHKLDQWRIDSHKIIDRYYEEKCQELDRYLNQNLDKQRKEIADLRSRISQLIEKQETTKNDVDYLTLTTRNLEEKMNEIEHRHVQIDIRPLVIDKSSINIGQAKVRQFDLMSLSSVDRTIIRGGTSWNALTSSDQFLLVHMNSSLCLIGRDLSVVQQKEWNYGHIEDMCWSSVLKKFFVVTEKHILMIDDRTISIEQLQKVEGCNWLACGCSDKSLYVSRDAFDSSISEFSLLPSIRFVKCCKTTDKSNREQRVDAIVHNQGTLALVVNDQSIQAKLIELRSVETFSWLWSIQLDVAYNTNLVRCCLLDHNEWLLADWYTSSLFHITNDEKLKAKRTYTSKPFNVVRFRSNQLAILAEKCINFHKL